jgi:hypothetical protein
LVSIVRGAGGATRAQRSVRPARVFVDRPLPGSMQTGKSARRSRVVARGPAVFAPTCRRTIHVGRGDGLPSCRRTATGVLPRTSPRRAGWNQTFRRQEATRGRAGAGRLVLRCRRPAPCIYTMVARSQQTKREIGRLAKVVFAISRNTPSACDLRKNLAGPRERRNQALGSRHRRQISLSFAFRAPLPRRQKRTRQGLPKRNTSPGLPR